MPFQKYFSEKVAIVTGASSGIGYEIASLLGQYKAKVALSSRSTGAIEQLTAKFISLGHEALGYPADITQQDQVNGLVQAAISRWGRVDILIANAGQYIRSPISSITPDIVERSMAINFYGHLYAILAVLPHMRTRRCGHIVLVSSMDAKTPLMLDAPYVAAKSALSGFGDVLRQELHQTGVHVTTVFPGRVDTPLISNLKVPRISAKIPAKQTAIYILKSLKKRRAHVIFPQTAQLLNMLHFLSPPMADWAGRVFRLHGWEISKE